MTRLTDAGTRAYPWGMLLRVLILMFVCGPAMVLANDRLVRMHADAALTDSGLLKHILPRFTLKTQVRIEQVAREDAHVVLGTEGRPVFTGLQRTWKIDVRAPDHPGTAKLVDWLTGDVGQRTVASFAPDGTALFGPPEDTAPEVVEVSLDGDAEAGHKLSRTQCSRCHAVDEATRGRGIGSTPSFGILRALPDWEERFSAFYALNPHPAFTQIADVTPPFPIDRPSPIAPVELSLEDLEALMAYVASMPAADLGKPLDHQ